MPSSYSPKIPFEVDENNKFIYNIDILDNAKQKLKMILLTSPGEKIYDPIFGLGIHRYVFEPSAGIIQISTNGQKSISILDFSVEFRRMLSAQLIRYSPDITIEDLQVVCNDTKLNLILNYNYKSYINDTMTISLGTQV